MVRYLPLVLTSPQAHLCDTRFCNISRAIIVRYPIKTNTKKFCDTIATSIARYEKYRCWASKTMGLPAPTKKGFSRVDLVPIWCFRFGRSVRCAQARKTGGFECCAHPSHWGPSILPAATTPILEKKLREYSGFPSISGMTLGVAPRIVVFVLLKSRSLRIYPYPMVWPLPRPWSETMVSIPLWTQKTLERKVFLGLERPFLDLVSQTPRPRGRGRSLFAESRKMPLREWNLAFWESLSEIRELLREYPGILREIREWPFHSERFWGIWIVPRLLIQESDSRLPILYTAWFEIAILTEITTSKE